MDTLVLHPGALGDILLSLPALSLLKEKFVDSRLTLAGNLDYLAIVPTSCADRRLSLSALPLQRLYGSLPLPESDLSFWTSFDRIVSWTGSADSRFAANFRAIHPEVLIAAWRPCASDQRHVSRVFADSLSPWFVYRDLPSSVEIVPDPADVAFAYQWCCERGWSPGTPIIALQPGAGSASKRWPLRNFARMALSLPRAGRLLIVEGPAEPGLGNELAGALPVSYSMIAENLPLSRLAAILSLCQAFVGNDSGISHLAGAVGVPCILLFGPTSPHQWAPLGPNVTVLRDTSGCAACTEARSEAHCCLDNISPDDVLHALNRAL